MSGETISSEDIALFIDLDKGGNAAGAKLYLIGAGAIQLGPARKWAIRPRLTTDWDFVVRVESWAEFNALVECLTAPSGGFTRAAEEHRLKHRAGGTLDLVPFGGIANADGEIHWRDGAVMNVCGLQAVEADHEVRRIESVELHIATLPVLVALKLLAYLDRRPGVVRDISDAYRMLYEVEDTIDVSKVPESTWELIRSDQFAYTELGAYSVGQKVRTLLLDAEVSKLAALCTEAESEDSPVVPDIMRAATALQHSLDDIRLRLIAFRMGLRD